MILEELTVQNFCLYRGEQAFNLAPGRANGRSLPVVLFGGINGGGKTTLLDAIQLALYGPRARYSRRASLSYEDYLRECIHRRSDGGDGAAVALSFRYAAEGQEQLYQVRRSWQLRDAKLRETLSVSRDGVADKWLSDNWHQLVEDLVPLSISQLFFFDAEKIRFLAKDETGNEALGTAIKSLLGLDLAERLIADATVLEARLAKRLVDDADRGALDELQGQIAAREAEIQTLRTDRAALENDRLRAEDELQKAEDRFAGVGGTHWQERETLKQQQGELESREGELKDQLVTLAASELPLAMLPNLLERIAEQDGRERQAAEGLVIERLLAQRDRKLLAVLEEEQVGPTLLELVRQVLDADRRGRHSGEPAACRLALSDHARTLLAHLRQQGLGERREEAQRLLAALRQASHDRDGAERSLAATPAEERIKDVAAHLQAATKAFTLAEDAARRLDGKIEAARKVLDDLEARRQKIVLRRVQSDIGDEETSRMADLAARTRVTMQEFLQRATAAKIDRLSSLVTESFRFLLRKQTLVEQIMIDPATFAITLYGKDGLAIAKQRLSEGEKQIFAISLLWGLARASARSLPAIIDTPMARLDAKHRQHLVERYFPNASHQVIILSTDTEVDRRYYEALEPYIARAYHLSYDDEQKATLGEEGYFWETGRGR